MTAPDPRGALTELAVGQAGTPMSALPPGDHLPPDGRAHHASPPAAASPAAPPKAGGEAPSRKTRTRKRRGADTQRLAATWFATHGWPFAHARGAGEPGEDIENMPGLLPEVKARRDFTPLAWIRQARKHRCGNGLPFVVMRPDGLGENSVGDWLMILRLKDGTELLRSAGYGNPTDEATP